MTVNILSNEKFMSAIRRFMADNNLKGPDALAEKSGIPRGTASHWLYYGIKKESRRAKVVQQYPQIFNPDGVSSPSMEGGEILILVKTELARLLITDVNTLLEWFLTKASADDRNRFRDELEESWGVFLELSRAMTSETAYEKAREENRTPWMQK
ncbi:MAG: hypothetical protein QF745_10370 [Planctomycetota bacterium]|jgi:hypothetical protein|nr:hypothetical protein [Planctomycetota bacterium]|tara:strand:+ start:665 stop:1129 length:465 start_codon:yes stop_codon:yes gene_type:complete